MLGSARALLHLINFEEPFGLSVVEAMACGTPVIAFNRGSMPELIIDGVTGFLVDTLEEAIAAVGRIGKIDRVACRAHVIRNFTDDVMRSEEHTSELQSLMRISYAVFCLKKKNQITYTQLYYIIQINNKTQYNNTIKQ